MKNYLISSLLFFILVTFFSCKEEVTLPNDDTSTISASIVHKENESTFILGTTNSDEPLTISQAKNLKDELKFSVRRNFSDDGTGSIHFLTNDPNNLYLPQDIRITPDNISYGYEDKNSSTEINNFIKQMHQEIKAKREKEKEKHKNVNSRIEWSKLKPDEVVQKFQEKGYNVIVLGNDLYEVSSSFKPVDGVNNISVKMVFNSKTGIPESSILYRDGKKVFENIIENKNGKKVSYQKTYGNEGLRKGNNFLTIEEIQ